MLVTHDGRLRETDVDPEFEDFRNRRKYKNVILYGRRGIVQSSFTTKELREMTKLDGVDLYLVQEDLDRSMTEVSKDELSPSADGSNPHKVPQKPHFLHFWVKKLIFLVEITEAKNEGF